MRRQGPERLASSGWNRSGVVTFHHVGGVAHVIRHQGNAVLQVLEVGREAMAETVLNPIFPHDGLADSLFSVRQCPQLDKRGILWRVVAMPLKWHHGSGGKGYRPREFSEEIWG